MLGLIDKLLFEHVGLPNVLGRTPSCLKVRGGWWVAHVILVSALSPNPSFFLFLGTFIRLGGLLGQGLGLRLGPGLDNYENP